MFLNKTDQHKIKLVQGLLTPAIFSLSSHFLVLTFMTLSLNNTNWFRSLSRLLFNRKKLNIETCLINGSSNQNDFNVIFQFYRYQIQARDALHPSSVH